jgi:hypothetical protein
MSVHVKFLTGALLEVPYDDTTTPDDLISAVVKSWNVYDSQPVAFDNTNAVIFSGYTGRLLAQYVPLSQQGVAAGSSVNFRIRLTTQ